MWEWLPATTYLAQAHLFRGKPATSSGESMPLPKEDIPLKKETSKLSI
jgi:hypothetical protein